MVQTFEIIIIFFYHALSFKYRKKELRSFYCSIIQRFRQYKVCMKFHLLFFVREIPSFEFWHGAPMLVWQQRDEELREVKERVYKGEGQKNNKEEPLITACLPNVREDIIEGFDLRTFALFSFHALHHDCHYLDLCE